MKRKHHSIIHPDAVCCWGYVYVLKGEAVTLVDCGPMTEEAEHAFVTQLKEHRLSIDDIDQVVLTHHHADHVGLLNLMKPHVRVIGHQLNEPYISQDPVFKQRQVDFMIPFSAVRCPASAK